MDAKDRSGKPEELVHITREFDAPREEVFKAWTECDRLMRWWGPKGFTTPFCNVNPQEGSLHYCMRSPGGRDYCGKSVYREIDEPERIVYRDFFVDEKGEPVSAEHYGLDPAWPKETQVTVTFADDKGKTRLTLEHAVGAAPASERDMCREGWSESLDKLAEELAKA